MCWLAPLQVTGVRYYTEAYLQADSSHGLRLASSGALVVSHTGHIISRASVSHQILWLPSHSSQHLPMATPPIPSPLTLPPYFHPSPPFHCHSHHSCVIIHCHWTTHKLHRQINVRSPTKIYNSCCLYSVLGLLRV